MKLNLKNGLVNNLIKKTILIFKILGQKKKFGKNIKILIKMKL